MLRHVPEALQNQARPVSKSSKIKARGGLGSQDAPERRLRLAKRRPRVPKKRPGDTKEAPKRDQELPKSAPKLAK